MVLVPVGGTTAAAQREEVLIANATMTNIDRRQNIAINASGYIVFSFQNEIQPHNFEWNLSPQK
jgi:hypothetical protein